MEQLIFWSGLLIVAVISVVIGIKVEKLINQFGVSAFVLLISVVAILLVFFIGVMGIVGSEVVEFPLVLCCGVIVFISVFKGIECIFTYSVLILRKHIYPLCETDKIKEKLFWFMVLAVFCIVLFLSCTFLSPIAFLLGFTGICRRVYRVVIKK